MRNTDTSTPAIRLINYTGGHDAAAEAEKATP